MSKLEKFCLLLMAVTGCVLVGAAALLLLSRPAPQVPPAVPDDTLTEAFSRYPDRVTIGSPLARNTYQLEDGSKVTPAAGRPTVLLFFASWCHYCQQQMEALGDLAAMKQANPDVDFYLVDKLDGKKETQETVAAYLQDASLPCLYDVDAAVYNALGMKSIPTTLILDAQGRLQLCYPGVLMGQSQLQAMLDSVVQGADTATLDFVTRSLISEDGGMYTNYVPTLRETPPSGHDVLAESQGLLMEYAADTGNLPLFRSSLSFLDARMKQNSLYAWVYSQGEAAGTNALLDELRILRALDKAGEQDRARLLAGSLVNFNLNANREPVDFYDFATDQKATRFTLCYGDLQALSALERYWPEAKGVVLRTLEIMEQGYIGDDFPLYHNYYSYETGQYDTASINMAEGLYTVWHLAAAGKLRPETLNWLHQRMASGKLMARYDTTGQVVPGCDYDTPALYALVGLIALEADDPVLLTRSLAKMEEFRCFDTAKPENGSFGSGNIRDTMSYDQCLALLLYGKIEERGFRNAL